MLYEYEYLDFEIQLSGFRLHLLSFFIEIGHCPLEHSLLLVVLSKLRCSL